MLLANMDKNKIAFKNLGNLMDKLLEDYKVYDLTASDKSITVAPSETCDPARPPECQASLSGELAEPLTSARKYVHTI